MNKKLFLSKNYLSKLYKKFIKCNQQNAVEGYNAPLSTIINKEK